MGIFTWPLGNTEFKRNTLINGTLTMADGIPTKRGWLQVWGIWLNGRIGVLANSPAKGIVNRLPCYALILGGPYL